MRKIFGQLAVLLVGLMSASTAFPCSRVLWVAGDGQVFVGRTNDWTGKVDSAFRLFPRGIERVGAVAVNHDKRYTVMTNEPAYQKQIENLKQYRTFGGDKPLPGERKSMDRFVRAAVYVNALPKPANQDEGAAYMFSVMRNVSVPFGMGDPEKPNISPTYFRTVVDLTGGRYYFESTLAPNVVWIDTTKLDFTKGLDEQELKVEKDILKLHGDVTSQFEKAKPLVFGMNKR